MAEAEVEWSKKLQESAGVLNLKLVSLQQQLRELQDTAAKYIIENKAAESWNALPEFVKTLKLFKRDFTKTEVESPSEPATPIDANLISSKIGEHNGLEYHLPVLDLDVEHFYTPSTTPGHGHLVINKPLTKEKYERLLDLLVELEIIEKGVYELQWKAAGHTAIRMPHVEKKPEDQKSSAEKGDTPLVVQTKSSSGNYASGGMVATGNGVTFTGPISVGPISTNVNGNIVPDSIQWKEIGYTTEDFSVAPTNVTGVKDYVTTAKDFKLGADQMLKIKNVTHYPDLHNYRLIFKDNTYISIASETIKEILKNYHQYGGISKITFKLKNGEIVKAIMVE